MGRLSKWGRIATLAVGLMLCVALVAVPATGWAVTVATIQGTVTNSAAAPLPGMHVVVSGVNLPLPFWGDAVTDALGGYAIGVPAAGDYNVSVQDPSGAYLSLPQLVPGVVTGTVVTNFTMLQPGSFSGTVTDALSTNPIQHIEVQSNVLMPGWEFWDGSALTDQYGNYTITGAYAGQHAVYFVDLSDRAAPYAPQWFSGAALFAAATPITVAENANTPNINAAMTSGSVLAGRVTDAGNGIPLGTTIITINNDNTDDVVWTSTSPDGTYSITGLPAGDYTIAASSWNDDYVNYSIMVTLLDNQVMTNADFAMLPTATGYLTGRAIDAAGNVGGIEVSLAPGLPAADLPVEFSTVTAADGTFSLPPRTGTITLRFADPTGAHPELITSVVASGPGSLGDFTLGGLGTISGVVTDSNSTPLAGAVVFLWDSASSVAPLDSATTGLDGAYTFGELPVGTYRLSFQADTYQPEFYDNAQTFAGSSVIPVNGTDVIANAVISRPDTIAGIVTDAAALPSVGTVVEIWHVGPNGLELAGSAVTDISGGFSIGSLVSGDHLIRLSGGLGAGYVLPGGQWLTTVAASAARYSFTDSLAPQTLNVGTVRYAFDAALPTVTITVTSAQTFGVWHSLPTTVTLTGVDAGSGIDQVLYTLDGGPTQVYSGPFTVPAGVHSIVYWATDLAGNAGLQLTQAVSVDNVVPSGLTATLSSARMSGIWRSSPVSVTLAAIDAESGLASITYQIDAGPVLTYAGAFSISANGAHTVTFWATDNVGNQAGPIVQAVNVDNAPPVLDPAVLSSTQTSGIWRTDPVTVTLSAVDAQSGVGSISYTIDGGPVLTYAAPFPVSGNGAHTVVYWATDLLLNTTTVPNRASVAINIDTAAPTPAISIAPAATFGDWYPAAPTVTLSATDSGSGVASIGYSVDGGPTQVYSTPFPVTGDGPHTVSYWATDNLGNGGVTTALSQPVNVDSVAPVVDPIVLSAATNTGAWYASPMTVTMAASDALSGLAQITYTINGGASQVYTAPFTITADGAYTIVYTATDNAGNTAAPQSTTAFVGAIVSGLTGTVSDSVGALGGMHVVLQSAGATPVFWAETTTLADGTYSFAIPAPGAYTVRVDDPNGAYTDQQSAVTVVAGVPAVVDFTLGSSGIISGTVTDAVTTNPIQLIDVESLQLVGDFQYWDGFTQTDPYGAYTLAGIAAGPHAVSFTDTSQRAVPYASQWYNGVTDLALATTVNVSSATPATGINAALVTDTYISGTVTDATNGMPLGGVVVQIGNNFNDDVFWTGTLADGTYRVTGLPLGDYDVLAQPQTGDYTGASSLAVVLDALNTSRVIDFALVPTATGYMTGRVVDASVVPVPLAGIEVRMAMGAGTVATEDEFITLTAADGTFALPPRTGDITLTFVDPTGAHPTLVTTLVATGPSALGDFVLGATGTISGTVTDANGAFLAGTVVRLWDAANAVAPLDSAVVALDGTYSFGDVAAGSYKVSFDNPVYVSEYFDNRLTFASATVITVADVPVTASAILSKPATITGAISTFAGGPAVGATVRAFHLDGLGNPVLAGTAFTDGSGSYTIGGLLAGDYILQLDGAGIVGYVLPGRMWLTSNANSAEVIPVVDALNPVTVTVDARLALDETAPVVTIALDAARTFDPFYSDPVTVSITALDPLAGVADIFYTVDAGPATTYTGAFTVPGPGQHTVTAWAVDTLGNSSNATPVSATFTIDTAAPVVTATANPAAVGAWYPPTAVTLSATDIGSGVANIFYTIDGGAVTTYTAPIPFDTTGSSALVYWAVDNVGNESTHDPLTIAVDATAPTASIALASADTSGTFRSSPVSVTLSANDADSGVADIFYTLDGGATLTYTGAFPVTGDGSHTVVYWATDVVGNETTPHLSETFVIDATAPTASISLASAQTSGIWRSNPVTVTLSAGDTGSGVASISYSIDGGPTQIYSAPFPVSGDGPHTVSYWATDYFGNGDVTNALSQAFNIDAAAPIVAPVSFSAATNIGDWYSSPLTVTMSASDAASGLGQITYTINGGPTQVYTVPFTITADGAYTIVYTATDAFGNTAPTQSATVFVGTIVSGVMGTVSDAGGPVAGMHVVLQSAGATPAYWAETTTLADGTYLFAIPVPGDYTVRVDDPSGTFTDQQTLVTVATGTPSIVDFTLAGGGVISGTVTDAVTSDPIQMIDVESLQLDGIYQYWDGFTQTDPYGDYTLSDIPAGPHAVLFTDNSQRVLPYASQWFAGVTDLALATTVPVTPAAPVNGVNVAMVAGTSISGTITDSVNGMPLGGVVVQIGNNFNDDVFWTGTLADGTYRVTGLPLGDYDILAQPLTGDYTGASSLAVVLDALNTSRVVDFALVPTAVGYMTGRVVDASVVPVPLAGIEVRMAMGAGTVANEDEFITLTAADGTFALPPRTGDITLTFIDPAGEYETVVYTRTVAGAAALGDFVLGATGTISGTVTDANGAFLAGTVVRLWDAASAVAPLDSAVVALDGTYSFGNLPAGNYKVSFDNPVYVSEYFDNQLTFASATPIVVTNAPVIANAILSKAASITGSITTFAGGPAVGTTVRAFKLDGLGNPVLAGQAVTDGSGSYTIGGLLAGDYVIQLDGAGIVGYVLPGRMWLTSNVNAAEVINIPEALNPVILTVNARLVLDETAPVVSIALDAAASFGSFYTDPVTVSITAVDPLAGVADIFYTVDAGAVTTYTGSFTVPGEGEHTVTAWAVDTLGNSSIASPVVSVFTIDMTAPVVSASASPGPVGPWYPPTAVTISATDIGGSGVANIYYRIDGGAATTYTAPVAFNETGMFTLTYWATDNLGNMSAPPASMSLSVDATNPTVEIGLASAQTNGAYRSSPVTVSLTGTDVDSGIASLHYSLDGGPTVTYTGPFPVTGDGSHTVVYWAVDMVGNETTPHLSETFLVDEAGPDVTINVTAVHSFAPWFSNPATVAVVAIDAGFFTDEVFYTLDSNPTTQTYTGPFEVSGEGQHTVRAWATDTLGNVSDIEVSIFNIDMTAPEVSASASPAAVGAWYPPTAVTISATDADGSGVADIFYTLDGGATTTYTAPVPVTTTGSHTVVFWAYDNVGNRSGDGTFDLDVDATAPDPDIALASAQTNGQYHSSPTTVTLTATDAESGVADIFYTLDGGPTQTYAEGFPVTGDGSHTVVYWATDIVGNESAHFTETFLIDEAGPAEVTIALDAETVFEDFYSSPVTVTITAVDLGFAVDEIFYTLDSSTATQTYTGAFEVSGDGEHTVTAWATDTLGNVTDPPVESVFVIDQTIPTVSASASPGAVGDYYPPTAVTIEASDGGGSGIASITYSINDGPETTYADPIALSASGHYVIEFFATDNVGNVSATGSMTLDVDADGPTAPADLHWTAIHPTSVRVAWSASTDALSGVDHYNVLVNGHLHDETTGRTMTLTGLEPGTSYLVSVVAVDSVGNESDAAELDVTTPASEVSEPVATGSDRTVVLSVPFNGEMKPYTFVFTQVTSEGTLSVTPLGSKPPFADMPAGFRTVGGFYDVSFTGTFSGSVSVTIPYDDRLPNFRATTLKLLHWLGASDAAIVDVTVSTSAHTATFTLTELSPIVLAEPDTNSKSTSASASWKGQSSTSIYPAYNAGVYMQGRLLDANGSNLYSAAEVYVQKLVDGEWVTIGRAVRSSSGLYSKYVSATSRTEFRFSFGGDPLNDPSVSRTLIYKPHTRVALNALRSSYSRRTTYTLRGTLAPAHTGGSTTVVYVKLYRYRSGAYRYYKSVAATLWGSGTTFSVRVKLPYAGKWKLVPATHSDAGHVRTDGRARYTRSR